MQRTPQINRKASVTCQRRADVTSRTPVTSPPSDITRITGRLNTSDNTDIGSIYITKDELDGILSKHFREAVESLRYTINEHVSQLSDLEVVKKDRDFYRKRCDHLTDLRNQEYTEFTCIILQYQQLVNRITQGMLSNNLNKEDTAKALSNINILRRANSSIADTQRNVY